jgi:hypothetical protein
MTMPEPQELRSLLRAESPRDRPAGPPVFVGGDAALGHAFAWLVEFFGDNDDRAGVLVRIGQEPARYLAREDLLSLIAPRTKGLDDFGVGDFQTLAGDPLLTPLQFRCPADGRRYSYYLVDEDELPACPNHPGVRLEAGP